MTGLLNCVCPNRTAMEKMKGIYEQNPQLGDAEQVAERMAESKLKVDDLNSEIEEFKVYTCINMYVHYVHVLP